LAVEIAKGVTGVKAVNNHLKTSPDTQHMTEQSTFLRYLEDANITARVKSRLLMDPNTHGLSIHTMTRNGVVFLEGTLTSDIEADLVRQITRNTKGVVHVFDTLSITKE
jgi:hyperosmotically inducible protein